MGAGQEQGGSDAKILTSVQDNLVLSERLLDQVDQILGESRDVKKVEEISPPVRCPLITIQLDIDAARKNLECISEKLAHIATKIW